MSAPIGIIGGSGVDRLEGLEAAVERSAETPWGQASATPVAGRLAGREVVFLPRHGSDHAIAPHRINYRANLWALHEAGVRAVIALAAVGGISEAMTAGVLVVPDQIIDYTWGREHTFHDAPPQPLAHVEFTDPYTPWLRRWLLAGARAAGVACVDGGVYGATQGPRLETAAEIERLARDGCDIVGMTGMPEAGLARELGLDYACLALVVNRAAGRAAEVPSMAAIEAELARGAGRLRRVLAATLARAP